jgi:hypothetical protein
MDHEIEGHAGGVVRRMPAPIDGEYYSLRRLSAAWRISCNKPADLLLYRGMETPRARGETPSIVTHMKSKLSLALLGLRISTILYYLIMLGCVVWSFVPPVDPEFNHAIFAWVLFLFLIPFVVFLEILILHLKRRKYWAWIAGLVVAALYAPSLFLPLGIMMFVGLLSRETIEDFEIHKK